MDIELERQKLEKLVAEVNKIAGDNVIWLHQQIGTQRHFAIYEEKLCPKESSVVDGKVICRKSSLWIVPLTENYRITPKGLCENNMHTVIRNLCNKGGKEDYYGKLFWDDDFKIVEKVVYKYAGVEKENMEVEFYPNNEDEFKQECFKSGKVYYVCYRDKLIVNKKIAKVTTLWRQSVRNNIETNTIDGVELKNIPNITKVKVFASDDFLQNKGEFFEKVIFSDSFYFEKIKPLWQEFLDCEINDIPAFSKEIKQAWKALDGSYKSIQLEAYFDDDIKNSTIKLLNKIIAIFDKNASKKKKLNPYADNRIIADSNVNQKDWISNLLKYKNSETPSASVKNAIAYIESPDDNVSIFSKEHREKISKKLLEKDYDSHNFVSELKQYFKDNNIYIETENKSNQTLFITRMLYRPLKNRWNGETEELPIMNGELQENIDLLKSKHSLNQILYGTPGTGKTYSTVDMALEILGASDRGDISSIGKLKAEFGTQVEFVTFHQSFSYEDFVEGLKASSDNGKITYEIEDGVFKSICESAKTSGNNSLTALNEAIEKLKEQVTEESLELKTIRGNKFIFSYQGKTTFRVIPKSSDKEFGGKGYKAGYPVKIDEIIELYKNPKHETYNPSYAKAILNFLTTENNLKDYQETANKKPHVLIIDEINRGNISRIFGELITLIEPSKRAGAEETISVKLPYSKEDFSVPDNLYIIGTMNTADRSLTLMDTALRRRFDFVEKIPNAKLVNGNFDGIDVKEILKTINDNIEILYDKEHLIGHSFLMGIDNIEQLRDAFKNKILPLLEEYFYDDFEKINLVLGGDSFYKKENKTLGDINKDIYQKQDIKALEPKAFSDIYAK